LPKGDSFEERLRRQEEARKLDALSDATARADAADAVSYCFANAPAEAKRLVELIEGFVEKANAAVGPNAVQFQYSATAIERVRRGIAAAEVLYSQPIMNAGPQTLSIAVYGASPLGSMMGGVLPPALQPRVPKVKRRDLTPRAINKKDGTFSIRWREHGNSFLTSEEIAESIVSDVADCFDAIERMKKQRE
jgi:hypothetical protein